MSRSVSHALIYSIALLLYVLVPACSEEEPTVDTFGDLPADIRSAERVLQAGIIPRSNLLASGAILTSGTSADLTPPCAAPLCIHFFGPIAATPGSTEKLLHIRYQRGAHQESASPENSIVITARDFPNKSPWRRAVDRRTASPARLQRALLDALRRRLTIDESIALIEAAPEPIVHHSLQRLGPRRQLNFARLGPGNADHMSGAIGAALDLRRQHGSPRPARIIALTEALTGVRPGPYTLPMDSLEALNAHEVSVTFVSLGAAPETHQWPQPHGVNVSHLGFTRESHAVATVEDLLALGRPHFVNNLSLRVSTDGTWTILQGPVRPSVGFGEGSERFGFSLGEHTRVRLPHRSHDILLSLTSEENGLHASTLDLAASYETRTGERLDFSQQIPIEELTEVEEALDASHAALMRLAARLPAALTPGWSDRLEVDAASFMDIGNAYLAHTYRDSRPETKRMRRLVTNLMRGVRNGWPTFGL